MAADSVEQHYTTAGLYERILNALQAAGKDLSTLTPNDLAAVDEFHTRGRQATEELARLADLRPGERLLDVGSGLGGTGRHLAVEFGCFVTGIDLTHEFVDTAAMLSNLVGLAERTSFRQASALDLPFPGASFDVVWTEHVQMNIADKERFYGEITRVLKPGGRFLFHDIFQGETGPVQFPVTWASDETMNYLVQAKDARSLLESLGLRAHHWEDVTERALAFNRQRAGHAAGAPPVLGTQLLMGADAPAKIRNAFRNIEEGRITLVQAVLVNDSASPPSVSRQARGSAHVPPAA